jgi:hypothetical protein
MMLGMLWFDNAPQKAIVDKINGALEYYQKKYNTMPDTVMVHPSMIAQGEIVSIENVTVKTSRSVMPNHFWVGKDNREEAKETQQ